MSAQTAKCSDFTAPDRMAQFTASQQNPISYARDVGQILPRKTMKFWINTVCKDHVQSGKAGAIIQAGHGKAAPLQRLSAGDWVIYYSPKTSLQNGQELQRFTAACRVDAGAVYQAEVSPDFRPFRRQAEGFEITQAEIKPLIESLDFIASKRSWGFAFRRGLFEISRSDFDLIAAEIKLDWQDAA